MTSLITWKRPIVVVGLGEWQGEETGEGWDFVGVFWGSPSTTSSSAPFKGDEDSLCNVFSGLERLEDEEVVEEEDTMRDGRGAAGCSGANET